MHNAVEEHMKSIRASVKRLWDVRDFKALNEQLAANERADKAFCGYEEIYSSEWSRDIRQTVETEIECIAATARLYLHGKSEEEAEAKMKDFALQLIYLGRILDDLPRFKDFCRQKMSGLLDTCHEQGSWGYCFLFKLGMLLGQGKVGDLDKEGKVISEDDRIGKTIVSEFKHFKARPPYLECCPRRLRGAVWGRIGWVGWGDAFGRPVSSLINDSLPSTRLTLNPPDWQDVTTMVWNEEVTQKGVDAVVEEACGWHVCNQLRREVLLEKKALIEGFKLYEKEYSRCFDSWRAGRLHLDELSRQTIDAAAAVKPGSSQNWSAELVNLLPKLVACVFCYFTICKSGESYSRLVEQQDKFDGDDGVTSMNMDNVLLKPHSTQVLTVLQMLGYGNRGSSIGCLQHQLMQIRTGEGKSIILGACSVVLSLLGFCVRCVCYSEYLSQRDYALFYDLFDGFDVLDRVTYSTITQYSEDVTKRKGDIRALTKALLHGQSLAAASAPLVGSTSGHASGAASSVVATSAAVSSKRKKQGAVNAMRAHSSLHSPHTNAKEILLVDEVDVFFGKDFYGQTHNQVVEVDVPEAVALLRAVWRLRTAEGRAVGYGGLLRRAKSSPEYAAVLRRFPEWNDVIERETQAMCADVQCFDDPKPHYDRGLDRLGYKVMDGIEYEGVVYRYRTAFA